MHTYIVTGRKVAFFYPFSYFFLFYCFENYFSKLSINDLVSNFYNKKHDS